MLLCRANSPTSSQDRRLRYCPNSVRNILSAADNWRRNVVIGPRLPAAGKACPLTDVTWGRGLWRLPADDWSVSRRPAADWPRPGNGVDKEINDSVASVTTISEVAVGDVRGQISEDRRPRRAWRGRQDRLELQRPTQPPLASLQVLLAVPTSISGSEVSDILILLTA